MGLKWLSFTTSQLFLVMIINKYVFYIDQHDEYHSTIAGSSKNNSKNKIKTSKLENFEDIKTKIE